MDADKMDPTTGSPRSTLTSTPLLAVVGVTDLAVERVRAAAAGASAVQAQIGARVSAVQADVEKRVTQFDPKAIRQQAQDAPSKAAARALIAASQAAGRAEARYGELAERGKNLLERIRSQASTQELVSQAGNTLSRGRATVTVARKAADETVSAILGTLSVGKREASVAVEQSVAQVQKNIETSARTTQATADATATATRKRATATKSTAKGVQTSARKTAAKAATAATSAAGKIGTETL